MFRNDLEVSAFLADRQAVLRRPHAPGTGEPRPPVATSASTRLRHALGRRLVSAGQALLGPTPAAQASGKL